MRSWSRPPGFAVTGRTDGAEIAAFEHPDRRLFGMQWHPEVMHTAHGQTMLERFLHVGAGIAPTWTTANIIDDADRRRSASASATTTCSAGSPGGVDSAVAAALVHRAVGDQLTCVFVDHGLLRKGEREQVERDYVAATGIRLITVDASEKFLTKLAGVTDPEAKRKIIGTEFIRTFEEVAAEVIASEGHDDVEFLVQGTLYPDVVESGGGTGTANIKSHHNVGGLPDDLQFELIEPLRALFKDEVRAVGLELGLPESMVWRQPFPGPGLAIRIVGAVDARTPAHRARGRRHRARGARGRRARARRVAVPGGAAGRRPLASACRATGARTRTRSCCVRSRVRTR